MKFLTFPLTLSLYAFISIISITLTYGDEGLKKLVKNEQLNAKEAEIRLEKIIGNHWPIKALENNLGNNDLYQLFCKQLIFRLILGEEYKDFQTKLNNIHLLTSAIPITIQYLEDQSIRRRQNTSKGLFVVAEIIRYSIKHLSENKALSIAETLFVIKRIGLLHEALPPEIRREHIIIGQSILLIEKIKKYLSHENFRMRAITSEAIGSISGSLIHNNYILKIKHATYLKPLHNDQSEIVISKSIKGSIKIFKQLQELGIIHAINEIIAQIDLETKIESKKIKHQALLLIETYLSLISELEYFSDQFGNRLLKFFHKKITEQEKIHTSHLQSIILIIKRTKKIDPEIALLIYNYILASNNQLNEKATLCMIYLILKSNKKSLRKILALENGAHMLNNVLHEIKMQTIREKKRQAQSLIFFGPELDNPHEGRPPSAISMPLKIASYAEEKEQPKGKRTKSAMSFFSCSI